MSTDDDEIADIARRFGAGVVSRPAELALDQAWTEPVIRHAVEHAEQQLGPVEVVAWLNASIPEIRAVDIDEATRRLLDWRLREVLTVDAADRCTSAVRVLLREALNQHALSVNAGVIRLDYVDIHYASDLQVVEERLRRRLHTPTTERNAEP